MRRVLAILGSALFLVLAPGTVAGLMPWWISGLRVVYRFLPAQIIGGSLIALAHARGLTVLANLAVPVDEFDVAALAGMIKDTEEDVADEKEGWNRDKLAHKLDRLKALQAALGH